MIFKDIFMKLLNCKILSQNMLNNSSSIWIYHKLNSFYHDLCGNILNIQIFVFYGILKLLTQQMRY